MLVVLLLALCPRTEGAREEDGERVVMLVIVLVEVRRLEGRFMLGRGDEIDIFFGYVTFIGLVVVVVGRVFGCFGCVFEGRWYGWEMTCGFVG